MSSIKNIIIALTIVAAGQDCMSSNLTELNTLRLDGSSIQYYLTFPDQSKNNKFPLVIILQGSSCSTVYPHSGPSDLPDSLKMVRLDVEKYGLNKLTNKCPESYLRNNTIDQRISDYLRVVQVIRESATWWNGEILIVGGSEGGLIAPILSSYVPEVTKVVIMAGGTGWTMQEEMLFLLKKSLRKQGKSIEEIKNEVRLMKQTFNEMKRNPTPEKTYYGNTNTFKWWDSVLDIKPLNFMLSLNIPILMVHGAKDMSCPVESARTSHKIFEKFGKTNLEYIEFSELDHHCPNQRFKILKTLRIQPGPEFARIKPFT